MLICTRCGAENQNGTRFCTKCQAALPQIPSSVQPTGSGSVTARYMQLKSAIDKVRNGEWSTEEYGEFLEGIAHVLAQKEEEIREISSGEFASILTRMQNLFTKSLDDIASMDIPEDVAMELGEEMRTGTDGIKLYLEAVAEMSRFIDNRNTLFLDRGLLMAKDANNRLNQAMRMNWENYRTMQETTEEFLRQQTLI